MKNAINAEHDLQKMAIVSDDHNEIQHPAGESHYQRHLGEREIRLFQLQICSKGDTVVGKLIHRMIDDHTLKYHALSYVWGSRCDMKTILCDEQPFLITKNLHSALVQLRKDGLDTPIWIDAICINQSDLDERARQVGLMRHIYSQAEMVYIWIGDELTDTGVGVELLHRTSRAVENLPHDLTAATSHPELRAMGLPDMFDASWKAVAEIITRPWFTRVWVIQELTVARRCIFLCGTFRIEPDVIQTIARSISNFTTIRNTLLLNLPQNVATGFTSFGLSVISLISDHYARNNTLRFHDLLFLTSAFKATDSRDKIFALVGLTDDVPPGFINYKRDLSEILIDLGALCLTQESLKFTPPLDILCYVHQFLQTSNLPSWVPEWDTKGHIAVPLSLILQPKEWMEVGESSYAIADKSLIVRGKVLDKVCTIIEATPYLAPTPDMSEANAHIIFQEIQAWDEDVSQLVLGLESYPTGTSLKEALWRALCFNGGMINEPAPPEFGYSYEAWKLSTADLIKFRLNDSIIDEQPEFKESALQHTRDARPFELAFARCPAARRFCVTQKGYIGWVSLAAQEGDEVVALSGTRILFTLRQGEAGSRLTGDCYLQGLMEGEPLKMGEIKEEDIVIV